MTEKDTEVKSIDPTQIMMGPMIVAFVSFPLMT